ncbi:hypothetical protein NDU88_006903 [Pleurodeles waltl]|uniref:Uncharacterized protein n=1 Tax=Pleurodeles waltl TaxID=8319 RepID=A0AAV7QPY5_PLEWA|nr:hypothetical protein NDU88_006903 [Pleurodeles waltl]
MIVNCTDNAAGLLPRGRTTNVRHASKDLQDALREFQSFNLIVISLAVVILVVTSLACCISYYKRRRQRQQAWLYETAVKCSSQVNSIDVKGVRMQNAQDPHVLLKEERNWGQSCPIFFIYDNPMMTTQDEGSNGEVKHLPEADQDIRTDTAIKKDSNHSDSKPAGVIAEPQVFYVRL